MEANKVCFRQSSAEISAGERPKGCDKDQKEQQRLLRYRCCFFMLEYAPGTRGKCAAVLYCIASVRFKCITLRKQLGKRQAVHVRPHVIVDLIPQANLEIHADAVLCIQL